MFTINLIKSPQISAKKTSTINEIIATIRISIKIITTTITIIIIIQMAVTITTKKVNLKTVSRIKVISRDQEVKISNKIDQVAVLIGNKILQESETIKINLEIEFKGK